MGNSEVSREAEVNKWRKVQEVRMKGGYSSEEEEEEGAQFFDSVSTPSSHQRDKSEESTRKNFSRGGIDSRDEDNTATFSLDEKLKRFKREREEFQLEKELFEKEREEFETEKEKFEKEKEFLEKELDKLEAEKFLFENEKEAFEELLREQTSGVKNTEEDNSGEKSAENKDGQGGAKEKEVPAAKPADKEVTQQQKTKENADKGNLTQNVSEETMAQFSGTSKEELIREVVNLRRSVEDQGKKITDLGNYIDTLVAAVMEEKPGILDQGRLLNRPGRGRSNGGFGSNIDWRGQNWKKFG